MKEGRTLIDTTSIGQGIDKYLSLFPVEQSIAGTKEAAIESVLLKNLDTGEVGSHDFQVPQNSHLEIELEIVTSISGRVWIQIDTQGFVPILASTVLDENGNDLILNPGRHRVKFELGIIELNVGQYSIVVGVIEASSNISLCRHQGAASFRVVANKVVWGYIVRQLIGTSELLSKQL
jgi:hypothetical protein